MPITDQDQDLIDRLLRNKLTEAEQATISERQLDRDFQDELTFRESVQAAVQFESEQQIKSQLQDLDRAAKPRRLWTSSPRTYALAAAVLALFILAGLWLWKPPSSSVPSLNDQLAEAMTPYPMTYQGTLRATEPDASVDAVELALHAYQGGHYAQAIDIFDSILADTLDHNLLFYRAQAHIQMGQNSLALLDLQQVQGRSELYDAASRWYLALVYLRMGEEEKGKGILGEIVAGKGYKDKEAQEFLQGL